MSSKIKHPYHFMLGIAVGIKSLLEPHCVRIEIAGSLRRKCELIGDIEIVCIPKPFETGLFESGFAKVVNSMEKIKGEPTGKYTQRRLQGGILLDIFIAEPGNWGSILAIRTGSAVYSHQVLGKGWVIAGYRMENGYLLRGKNGTDKIAVREERDLFRFANVLFVEPEFRNM